MHIYSAAFCVYAGNGLVPLVLIISSFVLLDVTGMVWLVAVVLLAHHTGRRGGGLPIDGGGGGDGIVFCPWRGLASRCFVMRAYDTFFADLSIVLCFPISFYSIELVYLMFWQRCGSIVACRGEMMMQSFSFPWWADHRVMVSVDGHFGILGKHCYIINYATCC